MSKAGEFFKSHNYKDFLNKKLYFRVYPGTVRQVGIKLGDIYEVDFTDVSPLIIRCKMEIRFSKEMLKYISIKDNGSVILEDPSG